jgi:ribonucleotide monophosphatase NagD (HAD superfamily)
MLAERLPAGAPVLVVGGDGLRDAVRERGLRVVGSMNEEPVAVVQGIGSDVGWADLAQAAFAAAAGLLWVAANLDRTIPVAGGRAPGNGTLVDAVAAAAGRRPDLVAGKPEPALFDEARTRSGARRPLMVGDRLDTDIAGARRAGIDSLFVLTGVSDVIDLLQATGDLRPTYVGRDLSALLRPQEDVLSADGFTCGGWRVSAAADEQVEVDGDGHADDLLRALCAVTWSSEPALAEAAASSFAATSGRIDAQR